MASKKRCSKKKKIEEVILVKQRNNLTMKRRERQKNVLMKKRTERQKRPWSDLPTDLLIDIMVRNYSPADQIRFRSVCKSWQQLPMDHDNTEELAIHKINKLPWVVVTGDWDKIDEEDTEMSCVLTCNLFDPKNPNPYSVDKILFKDRRRSLRPRIWSSKHGWLLFKKKKQNNLTSLFMFSPFTQQFFDLPDFDNSVPGLRPASSYCCSQFSYATFSSSDPYNDPNCEFFILRDYCYPYCKRIAISTCRRGDQNWTTRVFDKKDQVFSIGHIRQALYTEVGYLYCLSNFGSLVAYSVTRKEWIRLVNPQIEWPIEFEGRLQLIECEGGILLLMLRNSEFGDRGCRIFKFCWSSSNWILESSLTNQAIFVGLPSFLVPASGEIANKIFYRDLASGKLKFYCLKEGKSRRYPYLRAAAGDDSSLFRGWLAKGKMYDRTWIQSPQLHAHGEV